MHKVDRQTHQILTPWATPRLLLGTLGYSKATLGYSQATPRLLWDTLGNSGLLPGYSQLWATPRLLSILGYFQATLNSGLLPGYFGLLPGYSGLIPIFLNLP